MTDKVMYSSKYSEWETPQWFINLVNKEYPLDVDVCATPETAKAPIYYTPSTDGLLQIWKPGLNYWMNPPYGRHLIENWVKKAHYAAIEGARVICLVPARTDTQWWHAHCTVGEVRFIYGRLRFLLNGKEQTSAPFPSALVILHPFLANQTVKWWYPKSRFNK